MTRTMCLMNFFDKLLPNNYRNKIPIDFNPKRKIVKWNCNKQT